MKNSKISKLKSEIKTFEGRAAALTAQRDSLNEELRLLNNIPEPTDDEDIEGDAKKRVIRKQRILNDLEMLEETARVIDTQHEHLRAELFEAQGIRTF